MGEAQPARRADLQADRRPHPWLRPAKAATRTPISRDQVVTAAIRVLDAETLDAVSMRRVAQELDTGPASLYAHVANKKELLDLMFDQVAGEIDLPTAADPECWREQVRELAVSMHATLARHCDIARIALTNVPTGPNALLISERMLMLLLEGGVPPQVAAWALDRLTLYVCCESFIADRPAELRRHFTGLPAEHFPNLVGHVDALTSGGRADRFLFGLDLLLDGLAAQVPAPPRPRARPAT